MLTKKQRVVCFMRDTGHVSTEWSQELYTLTNSRSSFEAISCIRKMAAILPKIHKKDRHAYCYTDLNYAVRYICGNSVVWTGKVSTAVAELIKTYLDASFFDTLLPCDVIREIFMYLSVREIKPLFEVTREWGRYLNSDQIWGQLYTRKFKNMPQLPPDDRDDIKSEYKKRLLNPFVGDTIEVCWKGRFRLDGMQMYSGSAYWPAVVLDRGVVQGRVTSTTHSQSEYGKLQDYQIRYPGWDSTKWDQWVPREKLRWPVDRNTWEPISIGDGVEIWCQGKSVPGAWIEAIVSEITSEGLFKFNHVQASGDPLFVPRNRLRKVNFQSLHSNSADNVLSIASTVLPISIPAAPTAYVYAAGQAIPSQCNLS
jgi:hypothetical protein